MVIGLTGGIASGKSMIAEELKQRGFPVIDADNIAREIVEPGEEAYHQIVNKFGKEILQENGEIARKKLGQIIFTDESKRKQLNQIMHPSIRKRMLERKEELLEDGVKTIVFDIPLLVENKLQFMVDKVLLVYVNEEIQKERLMKRDGQGEEDALQRISSQMPLKDKKHHADAIIDNNGTKEQAIHQLERLLEKWVDG
ncbi:dephospho-CoA kinase [Alteribacillus iranensis]|uniref:Dephospho-CoA kinase n=2 Tax=Alteribacillus iranensis TaxID=930128 RepID=A0A1I2CK93_9BACI|nr:dephospho-CoA kinase [Alteribacillus iranensis]